MKLRSQILLFLFLFGFAPLFIALGITLVPLFQRLEFLYHETHLQHLRAEFNELDQLLASRREMVRLLAKLPEPGFILAHKEPAQEQTLRLARVQYTEWINQLLRDQPDITEVLFVDAKGRPKFWLVRNPKDGILTPTAKLPTLPPKDLIRSALKLQPGRVLTSPISITPRAGDPQGLDMRLRLASPISRVYMEGHTDGGPQEPLGAAVISIDVGGLANAFTHVYWVLNNGRFLGTGKGVQGGRSAFEVFPGLKQIFARGKLALWVGPDGTNIMWVPMFATENSGPLWVGRRVDTSPIQDILATLLMRVGLIVLAVALVILLAARWIAWRFDRLGQELLSGIERILENGQAVQFQWRRPEELRTLGERLTRLAQAHAAQLQALRAHARQLEETNRYKTQFLANVSHELRTPLNSILLLSKLLTEDESNRLPPNQLRQIQIIHEAAEELLVLINNILDLSRIEAGKYALDLEPVDLPELLHGVHDLFKAQFDAKHLTLRVEIDPEAPHRVITDPEKVGQIIKNFLANALKFTEHGGVTLSLTRTRGDKAARLPVSISVSDTGIGIPADKLEFIFEAFEQADGSTRRRYGGTGLGLTISRELASLLGGEIEVQSEPGKGSVFTLLLPADQPEGEGHRVLPGDAQESRQAAVPVDQPPSPSGPLSGHSVLVLEEDLGMLIQLTRTLRGLGMRVTAAGDLGELRETLKEEVFDIVLMDIMDLDESACRILTELEGLPGRGTPILVMIEGLTPEQRDHCLLAGASLVMERTTDAQTLAQTFERLLGDQPSPTRG